MKKGESGRGIGKKEEGRREKGRIALGAREGNGRERNDERERNKVKEMEKGKPGSSIDRLLSSSVPATEP